MTLTRRALGRGVGVAALAGLLPEAPLAQVDVLPVRNHFDVRRYEVCLNNARWHPVSKGAARAVAGYMAYKSRGIWNPPDEVSKAQHDVKAAFAKLINARPEEIAYVNSTTAGENLFVSSLDIPKTGGNIVTDALHFEGSLYHYEHLRKQGYDVRVVRPRGWQIHPDDLAAAVDKETRLVAISLVSYINGFEHDLKAVCALAHRHGALVYADAVQAAGAIPLDVRASGVDALGSASYKWLMGDMGIGFLFVRTDVLPRLKRPVFGFRQFSSFEYHALPGDIPGSFPATWTQGEDTASYFEIGTYSNTTIAALSYSLPFIQRLSVENIQAHAQALIQPLQAELPRHGYELLTPKTSRASVVSFHLPDPQKAAAALKRANVDTSISGNRMRVSPSVYNDHSDIEALLRALV